MVCIFAKEQTLTKRPRLPGREKQTPKTSAHERRKEDAEKKMEDQRARVWYSQTVQQTVRYVFGISAITIVFVRKTIGKDLNIPTG